jgi:hypothetical protein
MGVWVDWLWAASLGALACGIMLIAYRGFKAERLLNQIDAFLESGETVLAQLHARRDGRIATTADLVILTESRFYVFHLHRRPQPPEVRLAYADLRGVRMVGGSKRPALRIELPDQDLDFVGMSRPEVTRFEEVLTEKRPGLITGTLADAPLGALR